MRVEINNFKYTLGEQIDIQHALRHSKPWDNKFVKGIRKKVKKFHLDLAEDTCCYCQKDLTAEFQMVIDVEHVLPSSLYSQLTFEIWNLGASCKRCNMNIKKDNIDFINPAIRDFRNRDFYKFIHPNLDVASDHLERMVVQKGKKRIVKYYVYGSTKGPYTYDYFRLREFEIGSFDEAQGANLTDPLHRAAYELMRSRVNQIQR